ncbi:MAG: CIA30 family protein [Bryobacteraceae bacterium]|jgi:imidazolonepropionase-like amidohydrolase
MTRPFSLLLAGVVCVSLAAAQPATKPLLIEHVRVFDGTRVLDDTGALVEDGVIRSVGRNIAAPAGADVVDGTGKTLLPGLIDAHTHTIIEASLKQAPIFGVTTDLDMFTLPALAAGVKKQQAEGHLLDYADLRSSGYLATAPGGHGTEYGIKVPTIVKPDEAQAWVDARIAEGSDYIKAVYDDALEYGFGKSTPTLSKETLKALAVAAHARGKLLVVHIGTLQQAIDAIEAGADGLAHLFAGPASSPNFPKLAASHHIFVVATLTVLQTLCATSFDADLAADPRLKPYLPPSAESELKGTFGLPAKLSCDGASEAVRQLKAAQVPILAGTDAGNPGTTQGASLHGELELLVRAGLTPMEALHAATAATAAAFHLDDRGQIAAGKRADLLLVNGDPTADIRQTRDIVAVWKDGHPIDRAAWKASVAKQFEDQAKAKSAPPPVGSESGWISDFEQEGAPQAKFGVGWSLSTDKMAGGKSVAKMEIAPGGAEASKSYLLVTGEVIAGFAFPWSGVLFSPGPAIMAPANLSARKAIQFWAKGDGRTYQVMLFSRRLGYRPATQNFVAGPEWKQFTMPFASFGSIDGSDIIGIAWAAGPQTGAFTLGLDNIRLE